MDAAEDAPLHYTPGYPLFLDLRGKSVVVIGAGEVASRKIDTLLEYGAIVRVVAVRANNHVRALAQEGKLQLEERPYVQGDLAGSTLVFCACGDPAVDEAVCAEAKRESCFVNVVDVPDLCDFVVPSVLRRGPLSIAVSTSGAAPGEARRLRQELEQRFDESWAPYLELVGKVRDLCKERIVGSEEERRPLYAASIALSWRERLAAGESIAPEGAYREAYQFAFGEGA